MEAQEAGRRRQREQCVVAVPLGASALPRHAAARADNAHPTESGIVVETETLLLDGTDTVFAKLYVRPLSLFSLPAMAPRTLLTLYVVTHPNPRP